MEIATIRKATAAAFARRRAAIARYWRKHGTEATRKKFGISRQRVHQVVKGR